MNITCLASMSLDMWTPSVSGITTSVSSQVPRPLELAGFARGARHRNLVSLHVDRAAALRDDAVHRREPESGAVPDRLRREERLEDACARLLVHAPAVVDDL